MWNEYEMNMKWTMDMKWICNEYEMNMDWIWNGCGTDVEWIWNQYENKMNLDQTFYYPVIPGDRQLLSKWIKQRPGVSCPTNYIFVNAGDAVKTHQKKALAQSW